MGTPREDSGDFPAVVSAVTLSYWSRGRSQPERAESIRAVRLLEDIVDTPAGGLASS